MKLLLITLMISLSLSAALASDLCSSLKEISKNESVISALDATRNPEKNDIYKNTEAAFEAVYLELLVAARTNSLKKLTADIRSCQNGKSAAAKILSESDMRNLWSATDYDLMLGKISSDYGFAESVIHKASWTVASIGGAALLVGLASGGELVVIPVTGLALMVGGEGTSAVTALVNRSPSFVKRLKLKYFDDKSMSELKSLSSSLAKVKMKNLMK